MLIEHERHLNELAARGRLRALAPRSGVDFSSNDYLGLASHPALSDAVREALDRGVPAGSGGSRLLRGNHPEHEALEAEASAFFGCESALYFSSGYAGNTALLSTLPQRGDLVLADELIHASAHEGMRLGRAETMLVRHNDARAFEDAIRRWRARGGTGRLWIVVESLYSMDGDKAPLTELRTVAERHDAMLVVDEAHATGVFGRDGRGLAAEIEGRVNVITLHTCGKALGCEGALLCGPQVVRDFLVNRGRAFIFSTAPSPLMAAAVRRALRLLVEEPERRAALDNLARHAGALFARKLGVAESGSQIVPIVLGDPERTMAAAAAVQRAGFDVRGVRPPTVPEGTSRLRISITLNAARADVAALTDALAAALEPSTRCPALS